MFSQEAVAKKRAADEKAAAENAAAAKHADAEKKAVEKAAAEKAAAEKASAEKKAFAQKQYSSSSIQPTHCIRFFILQTIAASPETVSASSTRMNASWRMALYRVPLDTVLARDVHVGVPVHVASWLRGSTTRMLRGKTHC